MLLLHPRLGDPKDGPVINLETLYWLNLMTAGALLAVMIVAKHPLLLAALALAQTGCVALAIWMLAIAS